MSREKKLILNTFTSLLLQIVTVVSGLVLPRLFLANYGSEINGLYHSIAKFLSLVSLMEFGIGAVVQSALYKPLADNDSYKINCIITSAVKFYRNIAFVLFIYVIILMVGFNIHLNVNFDFFFVTFLIIAISIGSFARYLIGATDLILLNAAQSGYIYYIVQIITLIINLLITYYLISWGLGIQIVCLASSGVYLLRPIIVRLYLNKKFSINRKEKYDKEPIEQKWNGIAQHFSYVIIEETDTIILTLFSTLENVSIYGVYNSITMGIKQLITGFSKGAQSLMGDMYAKRETKRLQEFFLFVEFCFHSFSTMIFSCVGILIIPFVKVYTYGVNDATYVQPLFSLILVLAYAIHTLRIPYNMAIMAAGHYRQTQNNYVIAAMINLVVSSIFVYYFGLVGVAVGTLCTMVYQTVWMMKYTMNKIIDLPINYTIQQLLIDLLNVCVIVIFSKGFSMAEISYISWIFLAIKVFLIAVIIVLITSSIFYRKQVLQFVDVINKRSRKSRKK